MTVDQNIVPSQQESVQVAPAQQVQPTSAELPVETREKTREQFEKLIESNRRLFEANESLRREMEQRRVSNQVFEPIQQVPPASNQRVNPQEFVEVDPKTGETYINETKLRSRMEEIQQKASKAEEAINNYIKTAEQREIERQNKETFSVYPELDPANEKFDQTFNKQVRGILLDSMYSAGDYGGKTFSFKEAADFVRSQYPKKVEATPQMTQESVNDVREQVSAQPSNQPMSSRPAMEDDDQLGDLRRRTRMGDTEALARRLLNTEHILKDA